MKQTYRTALVTYIEANSPIEAAAEFVKQLPKTETNAMIARVEVHGTTQPCNSVNVPLASFFLQEIPNANGN